MSSLSMLVKVNATVALSPSLSARMMAAAEARPAAGPARMPALRSRRQLLAPQAALDSLRMVATPTMAAAASLATGNSGWSAESAIII